MTRDRVNLDELNHDINQSKGLDPDDVDKLADELAQAMICNGQLLEHLVCENELTSVFDQLARCMRNFEQAALGNKISTDACLNALSLIEKIVKSQAMDVCRTKAEHMASEAARLRGADD